MQLHPRVTTATVDFAVRFEGLRRRAARLPGGGWTVGYGHSRTAREGIEVTESQARILLAWDLSQSAAVIDAVVFAPLDANQFNALCDFAFNVGEAAFRTCDVTRHLNESRPVRAAAALELWRRATVGGDSLVVDAVVRRRAAEKALFLTPPQGFSPAPTPVLRPEFDRRLTFDTDRLAASEEVCVAATAPLDGDDCRPVVEGPRSAVGAAADALAARLSRIGAVPDARAAPDASVGDDPEPPPVADPVETAAPPVEATPLPPGPPVADGPPPHDARRGAPRRGADSARSRRPRWSARVETGAVWAGIGLIGLVLFAVGAVCVFDRPTLGCLLVSALGILVMAPPAVHYLATLDGGRR